MAETMFIPVGPGNEHRCYWFNFTTNDLIALKIIMTKKKSNPIWKFFTSVKLALFCLFTLAGSSIIGTIVPQNESMGRYIELYGPGTAKFFHLLDIPNMYDSWWFLGLLALFAMNLTICTIDRFPHLWKLATMDNLSTKLDRLRKMGMRRAFSAGSKTQEAVGEVQTIMARAGWKTSQRQVEDGTLLFSQKGSWTRLGVIVVHVSILLIFAGALVGKFYGYKASVMIPEGSSTDVVYQSTPEHPPIPLGFTVRCNKFLLTYYDTGMPKEFRSDLIIQRNGKIVKRKSIVVNDPLQYAGLTFYQASYQAINGQFTAQLSNEKTKARQKFILQYPTSQAIKWTGKNISFGIVDVSGPDMMRRFQYKIWFSDGKGQPSTFWMNQGSSVRIKRPGNSYLLTVSPRFATGLQVAKDPGVWIVYTGCIMMILGLIVIFFMSHRRIWAFVSDEKGKTNILVCGQSNKDKIGFEKTMHNLYKRFATSQLIVEDKS